MALRNHQFPLGETCQGLESVRHGDSKSLPFAASWRLEPRWGLFEPHET